MLTGVGQAQTNVLSSHLVRSRIDCGLLCSSEPDCEQFQYTVDNSDRVRRQCLLLSINDINSTAQFDVNIFSPVCY